jgi:D-alanyl-D-alanine carboxypeptidase
MVASQKKKKIKVVPVKYGFLFLSLVSFVFVVSCALSLSSQKNTSSLYSNEVTEDRGLKSNQLVNVEAKSFSSLPVLSENAVFPEFTAQAVLVVDTQSGVFLYEKDADRPLLPASTTKIVTALVALDYFPRDSVLIVHNPKIDGQKMGLVAGEQMKFEDLLYGLLVYSANDAAEVLASAYCAPRSLGEVGFLTFHPQFGTL